MAEEKLTFEVSLVDDEAKAIIAELRSYCREFPSSRDAPFAERLANELEELLENRVEGDDLGEQEDGSFVIASCNIITLTLGKEDMKHIYRCDISTELEKCIAFCNWEPTDYIPDLHEDEDDVDICGHQA